MKLFQSIFGGGESHGRYPESLITAAIERTVDSTDPRVRLLPGYRKRLREPVVQAIDHVIALVDSLPATLTVGRGEPFAQPGLAAVFASPAAMWEVFDKDPQLIDFLSTSEGARAAPVAALLLAERVESTLLGPDLVGEDVGRDVPPVTVSLTGHRLVDPRGSEAELRRHLKRRAFDHLSSLAMARIGELGVECAELQREHDLLQRKLRALERGGWGFAQMPGAPPDPAALIAELDAITAELEVLGRDPDVLKSHLAMVAELLTDAERQLWAEPTTLDLEAMSVARDAADPDPAGCCIVLQELHNARGQRVVMLPLVLAPGEWLP